MEKLIEEILDWIKTKEKKIVLGISGHGAAGKTTFSQRLIKELGENVNYLNTDPYIVDSSIRRFALIDYTYQNEEYHYKMTASHPSAHHLLSLERDILMLREGLDLYTIDTHYMKRELLSSKNNLVIVEGMSVAFVNPDLFDLNIYFYTDEDTELTRRLGRDIDERGATPEHLIKSHEQRRIQYELFMHPYRQKFDIVIKSGGEDNYIEKIPLNFKDN